MRQSTRLLIAAALCVVGLGLPWGRSAAYTGWFSTRLALVPSFDWYDYGGTLDTVIVSDYHPGDPRAAAPGRASDERVVLVPAAVAFALAAVRPSSMARRSARVATVALAVIAVLGLARGIPGGPLVAIMGVALAASALDWRHPRFVAFQQWLMRGSRVAQR